MNPLRRLGVAAALTASVLAVPAAAAIASSSHATENEYRQVNLVSDQPGKAQVTDANLVNAWGLAAGPSTPLWVANNGTGTATIYSGAVHGSALSTVPLVVNIPGGDPTGQVYNGTSGFKLKAGGNQPALFLFDSESGKITAWNQSVSPATSAVRVASVRTAVFKGLTIAKVPGGGTFLYATDFHNNHVDVYDDEFDPVHLHGSFTDPNMPRGYAPFNIQNLNGLLYVTYGKQDAQRHDEVDGAHLGFVDVYSPRGVLVRRLVSRGALNAPWGLVMAPAGFGRFSHDLLVGNFGDGVINAYDPSTGQWLGHLDRGEHGTTLKIDGLWGLRFGNGVTGAPNELLFSAGPNGESHGLLGVIDAER